MGGLGRGIAACRPIHLEKRNRREKVERRKVKEEGRGGRGGGRRDVVKVKGKVNPE